MTIANLESDGNAERAALNAVIDAVNKLLAAPGALVPGVVSGATYTFGLADAGALKLFTNAAGCTATIPPNAAAAYKIGSTITCEAAAVGALTIAAGAGVTLNYFSPSSAEGCGSAGQFAVIELVKTDSDTWTAFGGVA